MRSPEQEKERQLRREAVKRERDQGIRSSITRGRSLEASVSASQLRTRKMRQLRVLSPGNGAGSGDVGKFWFVVNYSLVGGPDIVPIS